MKNNKSSQNQNQNPAAVSQPSSAEELNQGGVDFAPSADEVARRAYFSYVNHGSLPGHDVQHWLVAEAELLAERNLTRVHGFHHHTKDEIHRSLTEKEITSETSHQIRESGTVILSPQQAGRV